MNTNEENATNLESLRIKGDIVIRKITKEDIPAVKSIADKQLGNGYFGERELLRENGVAYCAIVDGTCVAGFILLATRTASEFALEHPKIVNHPNGTLKGIDKIGYLATIAVDENLKGQGIGLNLMTACLDQFLREGINTIIMTGWKSSKGVHIGGLARRLGFEVLFEIENYWMEDSIRDNYSCAECGRPPCHCCAVVFIKHLRANPAAENEESSFSL